MTTRECYRRCVRAANTIGVAGYNHRGKHLKKVLRNSFADGSASPDQTLRTTEFLERAARYNGVEYAVIQNMIAVENSRVSSASRLLGKKYNLERVVEDAEWSIGTYPVPGPREYNEAFKKGELPTLPDNGKTLFHLIKYREATKFAEYEAMVAGINESLGLVLPMIIPTERQQTDEEV